MASVRFICGTQDIQQNNRKLKIMIFWATEDTILLPSCFENPSGLFEQFLDAEMHHFRCIKPCQY